MAIEQIVETEYGIKHKGRSKYVIVAPHGTTDDEHTDKISRELAKLLDASFVINNRLKRRICNMNNTSDLDTNPLKQDFFNDISELALGARNYSERKYDGKEHALVMYIHGMKNRTDKGIDIGIGVKWNKKNKRYEGPRVHPYARDDDGHLLREGVIRSNTLLTVKLRRDLDAQLKQEKNLRAWLGSVYAAWGTHNGIQRHAGTPDHSMQIEICETLRKDPKYVAMKIASAIKSAYDLL